MVRNLYQRLRIRCSIDEAVNALRDVVREQVDLAGHIGFSGDPVPLHVHILQLGGRA